ncbi:hypothetical protein ACFOWZ_37235 [Lentzea rhizosphaerae]|uniref:Uncharacterized protein n=1 Tax=Lentzea rhizosphaerae TaxID=2041025 RepID=A0ABV8C579_9PSEU
MRALDSGGRTRAGNFVLAGEGALHRTLASLLVVAITRGVRAMTLMRFDPFRELDRFTEQVLGGTRTHLMMLVEAYRRGDEACVHVDLPGVGSDGRRTSLGAWRSSAPTTASSA